MRLRLRERFARAWDLRYDAIGVNLCHFKLMRFHFKKYYYLCRSLHEVLTKNGGSVVEVKRRRLPVASFFLLT